MHKPHAENPNCPCNDRLFRNKVTCSACKSAPGVPCKPTCSRRPYPDPIIEVRA
jgi:hypothetical protein